MYHSNGVEMGVRTCMCLLLATPRMLLTAQRCTACAHIKSIGIKRAAKLYHELHMKSSPRTLRVPKPPRTKWFTRPVGVTIGRTGQAEPVGCSCVWGAASSKARALATADAFTLKARPPAVRNWYTLRQWHPDQLTGLLCWKSLEGQAPTHSWSSAQSGERGAGAAAGGCCAGAAGAQCSERAAGERPSDAAIFSACSTKQPWTPRGKLLVVAMVGASDES